MPQGSYKLYVLNCKRIYIDLRQLSADNGELRKKRVFRIFLKIQFPRFFPYYGDNAIRSSMARDKKYHLGDIMLENGAITD